MTSRSASLAAASGPETAPASAPQGPSPAAGTTPKPDRPLLDTCRMFARNGPAMTGLMLLATIVLATLFGPGLYGVDPFSMVDMPFAPPGPDCLLGTDYLGRDILAGVIVGGRATLAVGASAAAITVLIGVVIGTFAGYFGGWVDAVLMKVTEFFQILPTLLFAMVLVTIFSSSLVTIAIAIGAVSWTATARLTRAEFIRIRDLEYVKAARTAGARDFYLMFRVILPAALPPIIVAAALAVGISILFEAGLSFLGLGDPNTMSWGMIIGQNRDYLLNAWWTVTFPGIAIFLTVLSISLIGDGVNDALNPRLRRR